VPVLVSILVLKISGFSFLILANISICYLIHYQNKQSFYKYAGFLLTAFAFYVKVHVAVIAATITFSFFILEWISHKRIMIALKDAGIIFTLFLLLWVIIFRSFQGFFSYATGMLHLAADNSAAASLYPENNWILLTLFLLMVFLLPFVQRQKPGIYFGMLFSLSLFAAWKHGMAREDIYHARNLFYYVLIIFSLFILFHKKNQHINILLIITGMLAFYLNLRNLPSYYPKQTELIGINNFSEILTGYPEIKERADQAIERNLVSNKLQQEIRNVIGSSTADIYPWDYSTIPANTLNWKPRPVIQSFAAYTSWLDGKNAAHFMSANAPEYLIWDLDKKTRDKNGGSMEGLDNRYLLNDEPGTIIQIIRHYIPFYKNDSFLVLKKRQSIPAISNKMTDAGSHEWDSWIEVPRQSADLLRARIRIRNNLAGKLKSLFYKDEASYVIYKLTSGEMLQYRIVPKNARDGIWLNPFIFRTESGSVSPEAESIMLRNSNRRMMRKKIHIDWETIDFADEDPLSVLSFFLKSDSLHRKELLDETNTFDGINAYWNQPGAEALINDRFEGTTSLMLKPGSYSPSFTLDLDTITDCPIMIHAVCWLKGSGSGINSVISLERNNEVFIWHGIDINDQIINQSGWNHVSNFLHIDDPENMKGTKLKIYLWNKGTKESLVDNFHVLISAEPRVIPPAVL